MRGAVKAITGQDAGNLVEYLSVQGLKDFIDKDLALVESLTIDDVGVELADHAAARIAASVGLTELAREVLPGGADRRLLSIDVRDQTGHVLTAAIRFQISN